MCCVYPQRDIIYLGAQNPDKKSDSKNVGATSRARDNYGAKSDMELNKN